MADDKDNKEKNNNNQGVRFYVVRPSTEPAIEPTAGNPGSYDINLLAGQGSINPNNRNRNLMILVSFINGKQQNGVLELGEREILRFPAVKPGKDGAIEIAIAPVGSNDPAFGQKVRFEKKELVANVPVAPPTITRIKALKSASDSDGSYMVFVQLLDDNGAPEAGKCRITAEQQFSVNYHEYNNSAEFDIPIAGVSLKVKALQWNESFRFYNVNSSKPASVLFLKK